MLLNAIKSFYRNNSPCVRTKPKEEDLFKVEVGFWDKIVQYIDGSTIDFVGNA